MKLEGKVALVTGGASGIGFGISSVLASRGARVAIAQQNAWQIADAKHRLEESGIFAVEADIADRGSVDLLIQQVVSHFGQLDIVVNNASITGKPALASFLDCSEQQLSAIVETNFKGCFRVSQIAARQMVAQGNGGSIIHISSVGAFAAQEFGSVYCATKAAQTMLAKSMALELAPHGIRVNAVAPGDILTPANAEVVSDLKQGGGSGRYIRYTPLGRRGTPEEIGRAVAFLVSDEASFITGSTLVVDGGFLTY